MLQEGKTNHEVAEALGMHHSSVASWRQVLDAVRAGGRVSLSVVAYLCAADAQGITVADPPGVAPAIRKGRARHWRSLAHYAEWAEKAGTAPLNPRRIAIFGGVMPSTRPTQPALLPDPDTQPEPKDATPAESAPVDKATTPARPSIIGAHVQSAALRGSAAGTVLGWWPSGEDAYLLVQCDDGRLATARAADCSVVGG